jgi:hypothetical protein
VGNTNKKMWGFFINHIPAAKLETFAWWFSISAIILPILGGVFGWIAFEMTDQAGKNKDSEMAHRITQAEAATQPRRLTPKQQEKLVAALKAIQPKPRIYFSASIFDTEACDFAGDIESVLKEAGFETHFPRGLQDDATLVNGARGLHIVVKDVKAPQPIAGQIQHAFMDSGIEMLGLYAGDPKFDTNRIEIAVGQK